MTVAFYRERLPAVLQYFMEQYFERVVSCPEREGAWALEKSTWEESGSTFFGACTWNVLYRFP